MSLYGLRIDRTDELLNILQDTGEVSDNCIDLKDVPAAELERVYQEHFRKS